MGFYKNSSHDRCSTPRIVSDFVHLSIESGAAARLQPVAAPADNLAKPWIGHQEIRFAFRFCFPVPRFLCPYAALYLSPFLTHNCFGFSSLPLYIFIEKCPFSYFSRVYFFSSCRIYGRYLSFWNLASRPLACPNSNCFTGLSNDWIRTQGARKQFASLGLLNPKKLSRWVGWSVDKCLYLVKSFNQPCINLVLIC